MLSYRMFAIFVVVLTIAVPQRGWSGSDLGPNDVSVLMPPPVTSADLAITLSVDELRFDGAPVWPDIAFSSLLTIADGSHGEVAADGRVFRIDLAPFADRRLWHVASFRIVPSFPGSGPAYEAAFGRTTQVQMVVQPVTLVDGRPQVEDVAVHLIFKFLAGTEPLPGCPGPRAIPDVAVFERIVEDIAKLKQDFAVGRLGPPVDPGAAPLGVHPGLDPATRSSADRGRAIAAFRAFLERHLNPDRLVAMALASGNPADGSWIFLPLGRGADGTWNPVPGAGLIQPPGAPATNFAELLDFGIAGTVAPAPDTRNLDPISCQHNTSKEAPPDPNGKGGTSTSVLYAQGPNANVAAVVDVIADPAQSHLFNTDCVSCHTETRIQIDFAADPEAELKRIAGEENIDPAVLPRFNDNLRNFGWFAFPAGSAQPGGPFPTVTRRAARETAASVAYLRAHFPD